MASRIRFFIVDPATKLYPDFASLSGLLG